MNRFLLHCKYVRSSWLRSPLVTIGFTLLLAAPASPKRELRLGKTPSTFDDGLHEHHRSRSLTRCHRRAGLTFAFGEGGSKRVLAGVLFGVGMAIAAVNFLSWLFPGA